jgi:hypothetical protein
LQLLVYLPLELCTKRELEVQKIEKDPYFATTLGQDGALRFTKLRDELVTVPDCQYAMSFAYQRRGIALDMGDVMAYETHELLHQRLVYALMRDPMQGFSRVSVEQILEADARAFMLLAEATRDGIKRAGEPIRPCDAVMASVLAHTEFIMAIMPRQTPTQSSRGASHLAIVDLQPAASVGLPKPKKRNRGQRGKGAAASTNLQEDTPAKKIARVFDKPSAPPQRPAKGGGKGFVKLPAALVGMCPVSNKATSSKRLCFGFNLGNCSAVSPGQECAKGAHLCMKPTASGEACSKPHGALRCTA